MYQGESFSSFCPCSTRYLCLMSLNITVISPIPGQSWETWVQRHWPCKCLIWSRCVVGPSFDLSSGLVTFREGRSLTAQQRAKEIKGILAEWEERKKIHIVRERSPVQLLDGITSHLPHPVTDQSKVHNIPAMSMQNIPFVCVLRLPEVNNGHASFPYSPYAF